MVIHSHLPRTKRVSMTVTEFSHSNGIRYYAKHGTSQESFILGQRARQKGVKLEKPVFDHLLGLAKYDGIGHRGIALYHGHGESIGPKFAFLRPAEKALVLNQILDVVAHMHRQGFSHGDLNNPDHFVLTKDLEVTLLDMEERLSKEINVNWNSLESIIRNLYDDFNELNALFENLGINKRIIYILFLKLAKKYRLSSSIESKLLEFY